MSHSVTFRKSNKPGKKWAAEFAPQRDMGWNTKIVHFGSSEHEDYTIHKDKERRNRYWSRHAKDLFNHNSRGSDGFRLSDARVDVRTPGYLSFFVLWGKSTNRKKCEGDFRARYDAYMKDPHKGFRLTIHGRYPFNVSR